MNIPCPCNSNNRYNECCAPFHKGVAFAETAEELMRSRYSAYAMKCYDYLCDTTYKPTDNLKEEVSSWGNAVLSWKSLEIIKIEKGSKSDKKGIVEYIAIYFINEGLGQIHESSKFLKKKNKWYYVSGDFLS